MPHWRLFYHLVWATRDRCPLLDTAESVQCVERSLASTCHELFIIVHAIGIMPDHVHLACSIPPNLSISQVVQRLKGSSSHLLNQTIFANGEPVFSWQAEYGVYSFTERSLPDVIDYVKNQSARHRDANLWSGFEHSRSQGTTAEDAKRGN